MALQLIVNATKEETRVAILEDKKLTELYMERPKERGFVGNVYKGKVVRVLPGMQASFVDIGLERAAFLYVTDFFEEYRDAFSQKEMEAEKRKRGRNHQRPQIQDLLKEGQEVLVQIAKDPIGTKGARLTSHISLPGRNMVYMPTVDHIGVSRKIEDEGERRRLKELVRSLRKGNGGFIIRTAAGGQSEQHLQAEVEYLQRLWRRVLRRRQGMKAPSLVHQDLGLIQRAVRDFYTDDVSEMVVDDRTAFRQVKQFIGQFLPEQNYPVSLYEEKEPIFEYFGVEDQLEKALASRVWLKSGGYIIIDQTEALTSIDVNTGRFVGTKDLEETIFKTNLEAVKEIVHQLRLRNIGGLIILDMIDMHRKSNQDKVYRTLEKTLANDKAKTNVLQISELGLVEMTRKRTRENLVQVLCETCATCEGKGYHKSRRTVAYAIMRKITSEVEHHETHKNIEVVVNPNVAAILRTELGDRFMDMENRSGRRIVIREQTSFHPEQYQIRLTGFEYVKPETAATEVTAEAGSASEE